MRSVYVYDKDLGKVVCVGRSNAAVPDVFWDGGPEHGLADDPETGRPRVFGSKAEKAKYLKENNLVEAGDKVRGAPPSILRQNTIEHNARDVVLSALRHVREMGADVRRREYQRILKESRRQ